MSSTSSFTSLLDAIIQTSHDAFVAINANGEVTHWNAVAERIFGWRQAEACGKPLGELIVPAGQRQAHAAGMARYQATGHGAVVNNRVKMTAQRRNGELFPVEMTISTTMESGQRMFFAFIHDVSRQQQTELELRQLASTDFLTQMPNRLHFNDRLREAMGRAKRTRKPMALFFMDIDHFKTVNDTLGHEGGDAILTEFARRLRSSLREVDFAARLGGDEFVVVAEGIDAKTGAAVLAQKILDSMRAPFLLGSHKIGVTTSIGVSFYEGDETTAATLVSRADQAMYQAKRSGRNAFRIFGESLPVPRGLEVTPLPMVEFVASTARRELDLAAFMQESLRSIRQHLGMEVAFVSRFINGKRVFMSIDAQNGVAPIVVGGSDPLEDSYCARVVDGRLPQLIPDAFENTEAMSLPATQLVPVRAHLSVPIRLNNGEIYGTYCCFSSTADQSLNERDLGVMNVFADMLARQIERQAENTTA
ncbi:sensor domain-containing protein [Noviherbaspirillum galbum]|uniref:Diguanylate cyclase n=1 Tax=Noviherbaspirillum galbum TaxID=2709383 RepID=A0A6B3SGR3_9BURK|nr:diguanylate cyclase [Noviherbaspirillum galbum]NEX60041.1 diguanylate cyclase [Noviherbaspirillum galbum]